MVTSFTERPFSDAIKVVFLTMSIGLWQRPSAIDEPANMASATAIERRKQRARSMALVIVGYCLGPAPLERQPWLGAIERLHLALLVTAQHHSPCVLRSNGVQAQFVHLNLETAVGRVRGGRDAVRWQDVTTLRAPAREAEQRSQRAAARLTRVRSALTQEVRVVVGKNLNVHAASPVESSGQLRFLG